MGDPRKATEPTSLADALEALKPSRIDLAAMLRDHARAAAKRYESLQALLKNSRSLDDWYKTVAANPPDAAFVRDLLNEHAVAVRREQARANAARANAPKKRAKAFVLEEWAKHRNAYEGNKSRFARDYARRVKRELEVEVTEKTIRESWLP